MKNNKLVGKIIDYTLNILIVLFAIFLLISMYNFVQVKILGNKYSNFFGYSLFEVQTGSMHGTIEAGDWIVIKSNKDISVGDIVTYEHGNEYITHRIIESYKGTYVTKGDANNAKDDPIDQSQIIGKVVKIFHGFGILRRTIFNPIVILLLIVTLYLFNLTFKSGKTKFDLYIEKIITIIKKKIFKNNSNPIKSGKTHITIDSTIGFKNKEKSNIIAETRNNEKPIISENNTINLEKEREEEKKLDKIKEEINDTKEEELSKTAMFRMISIQPDENKEIKEEINDTKEEELSKTAMFRMISIQPDENKKIKEEINDAKEEDLSKTAMFRMISIQPDEKKEQNEKKNERDNVEIIDTSDLTKTTINNENHNTDIKKNKPIEEKKDKYTEVVSFSLNAEVIEEEISKKKITKEYMTERIQSKRAKNIIDKAFIIKKIIYDEIIDVLLKDEKAYISKSNFRNQFIDQYMNYKYFCLDDERQNAKKNIRLFADDLINKFIRDEKKVNAIKAFLDCFIFISNIEDKKNYNLINELKNVFSFENFEEIASDIELIINFSNEILMDILDKLETNTFEIKYNKIIGQKDLYGVVLNHNISFSKVYSEYIVDKTYNEGIVSEDKVAVLLNMLLCKIVKDLMNSNYDSKYIVYIPNALYGKDKKLDKIISTIDNEYAKNHVYFLTSVSNMLSNKDDIKRLRKKGYGFALVFNKIVDLKNDDMGYIYMADYYFIDSHLDTMKVCSSIPSSIINQIIKDNISKKIGDYGGE